MFKGARKGLIRKSLVGKDLTRGFEDHEQLLFDFVNNYEMQVLQTFNLVDKLLEEEEWQTF